jgi:hypothetical protein
MLTSPRNPDNSEAGPMRGVLHVTCERFEGIYDDAGRTTACGAPRAGLGGRLDLQAAARE